MEISVVYEDENIVAINKPAGLLVHATARSGTERTVADFIQERYPALRDVGEPMKLSASIVLLRPGIVHRLDRETSGIMLIAKNQKSFLFFKKQFQERAVKKTYYAIVHGLPKEKSGRIDLPIGRSARDGRKRSASKMSRGKIRDAVTDYRTIAKSGELSFLEVYPRTGRTHQIRVHLQAIGHPILCDSLYATKRPCPKKLGRLALHSFAIELETQDGKALRLEAPLPPEMYSFAEENFGILRNL